MGARGAAGGGFNPCFNGLSRRTTIESRVPKVLRASTLVLMDCPGGLELQYLHEGDGPASTLVLMDCPGGLCGIGGGLIPGVLQPLF